MRPSGEPEELGRVRRQNPSWVIVCNQDGTYTARRDWWGNQQIITVPTLAELGLILRGIQQGPIK